MYETFAIKELAISAPAVSVSSSSGQGWIVAGTADGRIIAWHPFTDEYSVRVPSPQGGSLQGVIWCDWPNAFVFFRDTTVLYVDVLSNKTRAAVRLNEDEAAAHFTQVAEMPKDEQGFPLSMRDLRVEEAGPTEYWLGGSAVSAGGKFVSFAEWAGCDSFGECVVTMETLVSWDPRAQGICVSGKSWGDTQMKVFWIDQSKRILISTEDRLREIDADGLVPIDDGVPCDEVLAISTETGKPVIVVMRNNAVEVSLDPLRKTRVVCKFEEPLSEAWFVTEFLVLGKSLDGAYLLIDLRNGRNCRGFLGDEEGVLRVVPYDTTALIVARKCGRISLVGLLGEGEVPF